MKIDIAKQRNSPNTPLKHCNVEAVYKKLLQPLDNKKYALFGLTDATIIPPLHERLKRLSSKLMIFTVSKSQEKQWEEYLRSFHFWGVIYARYLPFERWTEIRSHQFFSFDCLAVERLIQNPIVSLSAIFRILEEPGIFCLYYEESIAYTKFIHRLLHKADMGEVIGLLEKVGFQPPFLIQRVSIQPKQFVRIRSRKNKTSVRF